MLRVDTKMLCVDTQCTIDIVCRHTVTTNVTCRHTDVMCRHTVYNQCYVSTHSLQPMLCVDTQMLCVDTQCTIDIVCRHTDNVQSFF